MLHNLYCVYLNDAAPVTLPGIATQNIRTGTEYAAEATSGSLYPEHIAINGQKPGADFSSVCIAACLSEVGIAGLNIGDLATGLELFAYKHDVAGRASGAVHRKYSVADGLLIPRRVTCDNQGDAQVFYEVFPISANGTTEPLIITDTSAVVAAEDDAQRHTIGKTTISGILLGDITSWELDFGIKVQAQATDSDIYDTIVTIMEVKPVLTLKGVDIEWLKSTNIPLAGKSGTHVNTITYLRKRLQTAAGFVADGTAEHVKFTLAGLAFIEDVFTKSGNTGGAECTVKVAAKFDGTNLPVVINTASAIT